MSEKETESQKTQRFFFERLRQLDADELFLNNRPEFIPVLFSMFLQKAQERMILFCQDLAQQGFEDPGVLSKLEGALDRNVSIEIITRQPASPEFLKKVEEWQGDGLRISLKIAAPNTPISKIDTDFAVIDGKDYRFHDREAAGVAIASMNKPDICTPLVELFGKMKRAKAPIGASGPIWSYPAPSVGAAISK